MSRPFLILTTHPMPPVDDPSERSAVLAARRDEALDAWTPNVVPPAAASGPPAAPAQHRIILGFVDRLGRTHEWPRFLREHRVR
jgi:hypothetical protein